jgi:cytochrome P450 family 142 subfamily A polypeptide 1
MLDELTSRLPDLHLAEPDAPLDLRPANFVSGLEHLTVRYSPVAKVAS